VTLATTPSNQQNQQTWSQNEKTLFAQHYLRVLLYYYCYLWHCIVIILSVIHAQYVDVKFVELIV